MAQAYLFVHFREKTTPDGEQVYFDISRDGFHWEAVNDGAPVLWAYYGDKGVRDFTITHSIETGKYYIFATDLSLLTVGGISITIPGMRSAETAASISPSGNQRIS